MLALNVVIPVALEPLPILRVSMSNVCQVTGRRPTTGFTVSHSHRRNKRWFKPNIQKKKFYVPNEKRHVTLMVSAKAVSYTHLRAHETVLDLV